MQFDWDYVDEFNIKCGSCKKRAHLIRARGLYRIGDKFVDCYTYFVKCLRCAIEQPIHSDTPEEAIERWNSTYGNDVVYRMEVGVDEV